MATRAEKEARVSDLQTLFESTPSWLVSYYRGLSVPAIADLRGELGEVGASYHVVKNTLARIAATNAGFGDLSELFDGPVALTICADDPSGAAKVLTRLAARNPEYEIRGGRVDGELVDVPLVTRIAAIPSRDVLVATVVGSVASPLTGLVFTLAATISRLAVAIDQIREQKAA